jgi:hypothetical protein
MSKKPGKIPGSRHDVSRMEHENVISEVVANRRRFERLERDMRRLSDELDDVKKLLRAPTPV